MTGGGPDFYKSMLLYGLYEGEPVPLACDEQGRLILVIESVSPFDRAGTILLHDTFVDDLTKVATSCSGTGCSVSIDTTEALVDGKSCKLVSGSDADKLAEIFYYYSPSVFNKHGMELSFRVGADVDSFWMIWQFYDGANLYDARLAYHPDDDEWLVYDWGGAAWVTILSNIAYQELAHVFYTVKLVVDLPNQVYHRFKYAGGEVDLSAYEVRKAASTTAVHATCRIMVGSDAGDNGTMYLDDIIFTQDES